MSTTENKAKQYQFEVYKRNPVTLVRGEGCFVWDSEGRKYLDALAGIAVNSLGHCHPNVVAAIERQSKTLMHISNLYYSEPQSELGERLAALSGLEKAFICNSGAEAMEGALKLTRKYANERGKHGNIVSMENCFHGRTLATVAMGKAKYQKGYEPLPSGFEKIPFNDIAAVQEALQRGAIAIVMETVQGEGGVYPAEETYLREVRRLCDEFDALLILDEIQCGIGRTGSMFAYEQYGIQPDIVTCAKALGGGFPIGAFIGAKRVAHVFEIGSHGTTFGGNPLACAVANAVLTTMIEEKIPEQAKEKGGYFMRTLRERAGSAHGIKEIRGRGLMIGVELTFNGDAVVSAMRERGVLSNCTMERIIRIVPPLIISYSELDTLAEVLLESIAAVQ